MGRPFAKELVELKQTYQWASSFDLTEQARVLANLKGSTLVIGSGGSYSACFLLNQLLEYHTLTLAKALTPLQFSFYEHLIPESNVILLSSSGKNTDILFAAEIAKKYRAKKIISITMRGNTPLSNKIKECANGVAVNFPVPIKKDGFLATNSLAAFYILFLRIFRETEFNEEFSISDKKNAYSFFRKLPSSYTLIVLYSEYSHSIALDIESKFSEAGLGNVMLCDYRNFAHGRHNWIDKKSSSTGIVAFITPEIEQLAEKTFRLLPDSTPILKLKTRHQNFSGALELLVEMFELVKIAGEKVKIDPGKPGVPEYGSKIYHLKYSSELKRTEDINPNLPILGKLRLPTIDKLEMSDRTFWINSQNKYKERLLATSFGGLVLDYDGTICSHEERFGTPSKVISDHLNNFLANGFLLCIITGRGQSVAVALKKIINKKYYKQVIVGYYNGSQIGFLTETKIPDKSIPIKKNLLKCFDIVTTDDYLKAFISKGLEIEVKPQMVEIKISSTINIPLKEIIRDTIIRNRIKGLQFLESSHSIDIIDVSTSKLNILPKCIKLADMLEVSKNFLCIGDCGRWPGNDYQLLTSPYSLSVKDVSYDPHTCWNFSQKNVQNVQAMLGYLEKIVPNKGYFKLSIL